MKYFSGGIKMKKNMKKVFLLMAVAVMAMARFAFSGWA